MDDLIDREPLKSVFAGLVPWAIDSPEDDAYARGLDDGYHALMAAPAVDAVPVRHGRWKGVVYDADVVGSLVFHIWMCSECGQRHFGYKNTLTNFCPNCGADMRKGD